MTILLKKLGLALAVFGLLALPALFSIKEKNIVSVSLQYPQQVRGIASQGKTLNQLPTQSCEPAQRWRYRCDNSNKNCVKDRLETYIKCKSL